MVGRCCRVLTERLSTIDCCPASAPCPLLYHLLSPAPPPPPTSSSSSSLGVSCGNGRTTSPWETRCFPIEERPYSPSPAVTVRVRQSLERKGEGAGGEERGGKREGGTNSCFHHRKGHLHHRPSLFVATCGGGVDGRTDDSAAFLSHDRTGDAAAGEILILLTEVSCSTVHYIMAGKILL